MKRAKKEIRTIAKIFGVKICLSNGSNMIQETAGYYCYIEKKIFLNIKLIKNSKELLDYFFHELGHFIDDDLGKFKKYYIERTPLYQLRKVTVRAEIHADQIGESIFKQFFPQLKYDRSYRTKEDKRFLLWFYGDKRLNSIKNHKDYSLNNS